MKHIIRTLTFLCAVTLFLPITVYAGGIRTAADLVAFSKAHNAGQPVDQWRNDKGHITLEADIDMSKAKKFKPISSFVGVFDGQGYSIKNWKAKSGLVDELAQGGVIRNLIIDKSCSMKVTSGSEEFFCGFIAHRSNGLIENCENHGSIVHKSEYSEADVYLGGIVGSSRWGMLNCRNYGDITSESISTSQKRGVAVNIGGVAGGDYNKVEKKPSVSWCINYGKITYVGDSPTVNVAGVIGMSEKKVPLKYCVNRGEVIVTAQSDAGDPKIHSCNVSGVCANTSGNVVDCDNYGRIVAGGTFATVVGGVVGLEGSASVITGCLNYGYVSSTSAATSNLGGVIGFSRSAVHISNCQNHGEVLYAGLSPNAPSSVGGVTGQIYSSGKAKKTAYIRDCVNYGKVYSEDGGNKNDNHKAIKTGGIAGTLRGSEVSALVLNRCANYGDVSSAGGRCNEIVAHAAHIDIKGEYYDSYAQSAQPMQDGSNVFGQVLTDDDKPLAGVIVSDGFQCVKTDADGNYSMKSNLEKVRFVTVSTPSGYEVQTQNAVPQMFRRVRRSEKAVQADFSLKFTGDKEEYTMVIIGDPQMRGLGVDNSGERYRDIIIPDINQLKGDNENFYALVVGDLVYNWMTGYDDYVDIAATAEYPTYSAIGNHDMDQDNLYDTRLAIGFYENYVGPVSYSFNIGKMHYVVLNTITSDYESDGRRNYYYGLDDDQLKWLKNDLKYVPKDMTLVVCSHALLFQNDWKYKWVRNLDKFKAEVAKFPKAYAWGGHSHDNYGCEYNHKWDGGKLISATVSRCSGSLKFNSEMMVNGVPNGYVVAEVKGGDMTWKFKRIGRDTDCQMNVYSPDRAKSKYVKAAIWNWVDGFWGQPEWWENGVKVADMEKVQDLDVEYAERYDAWKQQTDSKERWGEPKPATMFRIKPSEGVRKGEVRVTDYFGNTFTQSVEW